MNALLPRLFADPSFLATVMLLFKVTLLLAAALALEPLLRRRSAALRHDLWSSALGAAHSLGIVHRNVRPENVFLARTRAAEPVVKLLDFGVALFLTEPGQLTIPGWGVTSPAYLSPEQLRNPNAVDQRTDLWALGLLAFETLVGHSPFHGFETAKIARVLVEGPLPLLPLAGLPPGLAAVVRQCLERDPARRPRTADEVLCMLEPFSSRPGQVRSRPELSDQAC